MRAPPSPPSRPHPASLVRSAAAAALRWLRSLWQQRFGGHPPIGAEGQARMLAMVGSRVSAEIAGFVIPPVLIWMVGREHDAAPLLAWAGVYWGVCIIASLARRRFRRDLVEGPAARVSRVWGPRFCAMAAAYGTTWGALPWATMGASSHEFATLVYLVLSAVLASTAVLAAPVYRVFLCFFAGCWGGGTAALYGMFPLHWPWVLPMQVLYGVIILRHAGATHRFVVEQVRLEERSAELARSYQAARDLAQAALRAKSEFLARASHDLRQPVHALSMIADALARRSTDPQAAPVLSDLKSCVHTLHLMFESLMDLSQLQSGTLQAHPQEGSLGALLAEVDVQFRGEAAARMLRWRVRLPAQGAWVRADPVLLRRAVFNLIHNALRYTHRGGVLVAVRRRAGQWRIEVRDTGLGVAEVDRDSIYAPFFRHADASRMHSSGHGLGLAVFAECVSLMGARSGLVSQPGRGSCFWLSLDAVAGSPAALRGRCLVVDGDAQLTARWAGWLTGWGVESRFAGSAAQAERIVAEGFQPDVIFCSERLQPAEQEAGGRANPSGFSLLKRLLGRCPAAAGALLCADPAAPQPRQADEQGYIVLRQPVAPDTLLVLLTRWLTTPALRAAGPGRAPPPGSRPAPARGHGGGAPHAGA